MELIYFCGTGNFQLPVKGDPFDEVRYEELSESESRKLVEMYNKEAADAGFGPSSPHKRPRTENRSSRFSDRTDRGGGGRYGGKNLSGCSSAQRDDFICVIILLWR
jgi:hypothetical protein